MSPAHQIEPQRGRFDGVRQIVRYNWPQYVVGAALVSVAAAWLFLSHYGTPWFRLGVAAAALLAAWWLAASLGASHWIYDRSELCRWTWIPRWLPTSPRRWLNLHAGLDESSLQLRRLFPESSGTTADFYDAREMSEPSIARARQEQQGSPPAMHVSYRPLPFPDQSFDTVFLLFAAHELRRAESRDAFFREVCRVLTPGGSLLLVEHVRDANNFAAFGPGFMHFLSCREWRRLLGGGFELIREERMTPFVLLSLARKAA